MASTNISADDADVALVDNAPDTMPIKRSYIAVPGISLVEFKTQLIVAGVSLLACLVSIKHSDTYGKWVRMDGPWFGPSNGVKALAGLSVLHATGLYICRRWHVVPSVLVSTAGLVLHTAILYVGTVVNGILTHRPGASNHVNPCTITITFAMWSASCAYVCTFTPTGNESFWVAYAAGFIATEHLRWVTDFGVGDVVVDGALGGIFVTVSFVAALLCVSRLNKPFRDAVYIAGVSAFLGTRLALGYHIHHAEWPMYAAYPLRRETSGRAMGVLVGVMAQEIAGGDGYRVFCDTCFINFFKNLVK